MSQSYRNVFLVLATGLLLLSVTLMLLSWLTLIKVSQLAVLILMFAATYLFYSNLAPNVQSRIRDIARSWWLEFRQKCLISFNRWHYQVKAAK